MDRIAFGRMEFGDGTGVDLSAAPTTRDVMGACTHGVKKTTYSGGAYASGFYCCDECHTPGSTERGRWHCAVCQIDICPDCHARNGARIPIASFS